MNHNLRPLWRAALTGFAIAVAEAISSTVVALSLDSFGRVPSGYAGAALGQAMGMLFMITLAMAACVGLIAGATLLRRKRGVLVEWSLMLGCLAFFVVLPIYVFIISLENVNPL